ncbi:hypothetical protein [Endozoicomonas sp. 4G]|uniref:hypothetical protein n=1 Tax=Endozoicomonas sp. 4G TaxID=2872754 RepID=UPI002078606B|nr:hypothetical protein [Endozoicomonas sp. 4G]
MATGGPNLPVNGPGSRRDTLQNPSIPPAQPAKAKLGPRDVSVQEKTDAALSGEAGHYPPPYVPIHKRDVVIEKVKRSFLALILQGFSKVAMPLVKAAIGFSGNRANDQLESNEQFVNENTKTRNAFQTELKSIQAKLKKLRKKLPDLESKEQDQFSALQQRFFQLRAELRVLKRNFDGISETKPLLKAWSETIKDEMKDYLKLIEKHMGPGLKLLQGLRHVFGKSKKGRIGDKVYHIDLGNLSTKLSSGAELKVQNIGVFIEQCYMSPTNELTLDIADIRADVSSTGASGEVEPMTLSGGISIKLKPPASNKLFDALTQKITNAPTHLYNLSKELKPVFDGMFKNPPRSRLSDMAEVSIKSLQLEKKDGQTLALQDAPFAHSLLDLMIPVMSGSSELPIAAKSLEQQWKDKGLEVVCESLVEEEKELTDDLHQLSEDIKSLPEGGAKDSCQEMSDRWTTELRLAANEKEAKIRELTLSRQARSVQQQRLENIDSSFDINRGMIDLVYGLAAVANGSQAGLKKPIAISEMKIPVSDTCSVDLSQLKINVSDFSFSQLGVAELTIPEMASHITLQNEATREKRSVPVIVRGASIKIRPPYGPLVKEVLQLKFPVDSKTLEKVVMPIYREADKKKQSGGAKITDYLDIDLGTVACLTREGEMAFSGEEGSPYQQQRQAFFEKAGELLSANVNAKVMASALALAGLTPESQQKVWKLCEEGIFADSAVFAPEKLAHLVLPFSEQEQQQERVDEERVGQERVDELIQDESDEGYSSSTSLEEDTTPDVEVSEPERLESIKVNARINDTVTPPSSPLPAEVEPPKVEKAPAKTPLSGAVAQPAPKKPPEGLKFRDLKNCIGVSNPRFRTEEGKRMADFEMHIAPRSLMKKLSWWMGFFLGKKEVAVEVTLPIERESSQLQLQSPSVQLKKRTSFNPVVWLATSLVNRRLRKQPYQLELDQVEQQKRLTLTHKPLASPV